MRVKRILSIVTVGILTLAAFWGGSAYAATGCFKDTNGHPFEQAICWMKENGLAGGKRFRPDDPTTRGQAAAWLQKVADIPPSSGLILISEGFANWRPLYSTDNVTFENYSNATYLRKAGTGSNYFSLQPSLPTALYGRELSLLGVEFCYTASSSAALSYVEINTYTHSTGVGARTLQFSDGTDRTDSACRYYVLPTTVTLTAEDGANIFIQGQWFTANSPLLIGRTTFVLAPTNLKIVPPSVTNAVPLKEGGASGADSTGSPQDSK